MEDASSEEKKNAESAVSISNGKPTVVGIGASAGGLSALKRLFELIPADSGLTFVIVVHLSPEHKSHLPDLLQSSVRFPVQQVTETMPLEPNNVYVIPPNANLNTIDTHLRLSNLEEHRRERAPIDHFFRTLAATHDGHSIGVILTGTGSDGTLGLKEIKAKGGLILVQDPNEAEYDGMPQSAIATGLVDRILPLAEIAEALVRLTQVGFRIDLNGHDKESLQPERVLLPKVLAILKARTERDFSRYKTATILRRIARRMQLNYIEDFELYLERLREHPEEARALADDLLITVTSFFRDPEVFHKLESEIVPNLFKEKGPEDTLRVWSVGCATGEEAYSVAILLLEEAARREASPKIQIFASDLHKRSLEDAREGLYPGDIETDVSAERLRRFFRKENGGYRIAKEVRDCVVFAPHNLLSDPPFSRLHLITCRNLLIYLDRPVQRDVIDLFHYALCPSGYLLLGSAETIDTPELFRTEDKKLCLYRKRNVPAPEPRLPVFPLTHVRATRDRSLKLEPSTEPTPYHIVHQQFLERYAPPSILIGSDNKLVHLSEHAGRYLVHPGGEVTVSALKLVREELRIELQGLLQTARETKALVDSRPISVRFNGHSAPVVMHVRPSEDADEDGFVLVIFEEHSPEPESTRLEERHGTTAEAEQDGKRIAELEGELSAARQRLQTIIEEYETSQEEMKASAEEMQSTNEELRSTMEELETSKEELQSINEELQTVNQENRHKVEELSQLSSDLQNLLSATEIATLFLDRDLRILRFTPKVSELFNIRVTDRGRPISDLTHRLGYPQLREDAQAVLDRLIPAEREIGDDRQRWYLTRVLPYRSTEDRIEGVVITFTDITAQKSGEATLRQSEERHGFLLKLTDVLRPLGNASEIQLAASRLLSEHLKADRAFYCDIEGEPGERVALVRGQYVRDGTPLPEELDYETFERGWASEILSRGEAVVVADTDRSARMPEAAKAAWRSVDVRALIVIALIKNRRESVNFGVFQNRPRHWSTYEVELVREVAERTWAAAERARDKAALGESEERQRTLLEGMPQLVWRSQDNGQWSWTSPQWSRFTGLTQQESLGRGWLNAVHPDDRELAKKHWAEAASEGRLDVEYRLCRAGDQAYLWHHTRALPVRSPNGQILEWLGTSTDVEQLKHAESARREAERQFRLFAENVQEYALVQTDAEGLITSWNPGARRLFGYTAEQMVGRNFDRLLTPQDLAAGIFREELEMVSSGKRHEDARWLLRENGSRFWARWISEPISDETGVFRGIAKIMRDETERQLAADRIQQSLLDKEELLKEVHHRVKNNLQVIVSLLNMQTAQIQDERVLTPFQETRNRVLAISSIHELLHRSESAAKIALGEYTRELTSGLVRFYGLESRVQVEIRAHGAALELERAVPYGMLVNELISNACKHAFPGNSTGKITISIETDGSEIELVVADTGNGLPESFDYQKASSLGLKLVHGLVRQLRGSIDIRSKEGTTVKVRLPAAEGK